MLQKEFVGRQQEQEQYREFLTGRTPWLLLIIGLGGIGKSTLLKQLKEKQTPPDTFVALLDFDKDSSLRTDPLRFLEELACLLQPNCGEDRCTAFKETLQSGREQLETLHRQMDQDSRESTGVKMQQMQGSTLVMQKIQSASQEVYRQVRELVTEAFFEQVELFDLQRLVIMLDTCELLNEPDGCEVGQWLVNEFLPRLHLRLQQQLCFVIIASRVPLQSKVIDKREQELINLSMLDEEAVNEYLESRGMDDPELRKQVFEITHGHALIVTTIASMWQEQLIGEKDISTLKAQAQEKIQEFSEEALMGFTNERILNRLDFPYKELTQYGVLLRSFNLTFLQEVFPDFLLKKSPSATESLTSAEVRERFDHFIRYPFIVPLGNYRYAFHELLRAATAAQTQEEHPEEWKRYHKLALDYLVRVSPQSPDLYYHAIGSDEEKGMELWQQALNKPRKREDQYLGELLQVAFDKALKLTPAAQALREYERGRFYHYGMVYDIDLEAALKSYNESLKLFKQVGDHAGEAMALQAIGDVYRIRSEAKGIQQNEVSRRAAQDAALDSYHQALELFQQEGDRLGEAKVREAMGYMHLQRRSRGLSVWIRVLILILALFIIAGSISFSYVSVIRPTQISAQATALANMHATDTVQAEFNNFQTFVAQTTATATALQNIYTRATTGNPVFNDPLIDNSQGNGWAEGSSQRNYSCQFTGGAYHAFESETGYFVYCPAYGMTFYNFAYQVNLTITKGDVGGIIFRLDSTNTKFYFFGIDQDGSYFLYRDAGNNSTLSQTLKDGSSPAIRMGLNQPNLVAVVATNNNLYFYVNKQFVTSVADSTLSSGGIGVAAQDNNSPTEVTFSDARVWVVS